MAVNDKPIIKSVKDVTNHKVVVLPNPLNESHCDEPFNKNNGVEDGSSSRITSFIVNDSTAEIVHPNVQFLENNSTFEVQNSILNDEKLLENLTEQDYYIMDGDFLNNSSDTMDVDQIHVSEANVFDKVLEINSIPAVVNNNVFSNDNSLPLNLCEIEHSNSIIPAKDEIIKSQCGELIDTPLNFSMNLPKSPQKQSETGMFLISFLKYILFQFLIFFYPS